MTTRSTMHRTATRIRTTVLPHTPSRRNSSVDAEATTSSPSAGWSRFRIYNDSMPPSSQPETPQNLPEARHQSRLHPSFTLPVRRGSSLDMVTPATGWRWRPHPRQPLSPAGLRTPGFLGLYGGVENSDEAALFEQAERDRAARTSRFEHSSSPGL